MWEDLGYIERREKMNRYELLREGTTIYELDEDGVNRWIFSVQPGIGLDGYRQPYSVIERVAKDAQVSMNHHHRLREALLPFAAFACSPVGECGCNNCAARALLDELDNLEPKP